MNIYQSGKTIISHLYALIKSVQVYDLKNAVVLNAASRTMNQLEQFFKYNKLLEILRYRDYIFINKTRLRFEIDGYANLQFFDERFKKLGIKSVILGSEVSEKELIQFADIFKEDKTKFLQKYTTTSLKNIHIEFSTSGDEIPEFLKNGERIKRSYFKALKVTKDLMQNIRAKQPVNIRSSRRVVYTLIENLSQDEFGLLALTTIKNFDEYTYNHSLNVGILALALGQRIGLDRKSLVQLGTAGLMHDIGKVEISKDLLYKKSKLASEERGTIELHSTYGVRQILRTRGLDDVGISSMIATYQHHWNYDGSGYPQVQKEEFEPILYGRIIRICDAYDAMTTSRPYQVVPYPPHIAICVIWSRRDTYFDPMLAKVFIELMGLYPMSSCVELNTGEVGIVVSQNPGYFDLPTIKLVIDKEGHKIDGKVLDLSLNKEVKICKTIYPQKYNINPAEYFLS